MEDFFQRTESRRFKLIDIAERDNFDEASANDVDRDDPDLNANAARVLIQLFNSPATTDRPKVREELKAAVEKVKRSPAAAAALYLRVMLVAAQPRLKQTALMEIASQMRPDVPSQHRFAGYLDRNRFGVIALEYSGTSTTPRSLTQLFLSGEAWGISTHFFALYQGLTLIPTTALENIYRRVLSNYCEILDKG